MSELYWREKAEKALRDLDDARREIERLTGELHASKATSAAIFQANIDATEASNEASRSAAAHRVRALAARLTAQTEREQRDTLANELSELRTFALAYTHAASTLERELALSNVIARLVRPSERVAQLGIRAAADALRSMRAAENTDGGG